MGTPLICDSTVFLEVRVYSRAMAGLVKAKKYEWKDSNLALFGSDVEKKVSFSYKMAAVFRWYVY